MAITTANLQRINTEVKERVPLVNWGGCGFYATLIQQRMRELGHTAFLTGMYGYDPEEQGGADHVFTIVVIDGKSWFHDGEDTTPIESWQEGFARPDFTGADKVNKLVNSNRWNTVFEAETEVPILVECIEEVLGKFETVPHFHTIQGINV